jgi:hypothetical protein
VGFLADCQPLHLGAEMCETTVNKDSQ